MSLGPVDQFSSVQNLYRPQGFPSLPGLGALDTVSPQPQQGIRDQVSFQGFGDMLSGIGEWATDTLGSIFGGGSRPAAQPAAADAAPAEAPQTAQSAVLDQMKSTGDDLLRRGSNGPEVESLQKMLKAEGYDLGPAGVDGKFGPKTQAAVEAFQRDQAAKAKDPDQAIAVDGIVGAETRAALGNERLAEAAKIDDTVAKLNAGGPRDGIDAKRAEDAKKAADARNMADTVSKLNAGGPRDGIDAKRAADARSAADSKGTKEAGKAADPASVDSGGKSRTA